MKQRLLLLVAIGFAAGIALAVAPAPLPLVPLILTLFGISAALLGGAARWAPFAAIALSTLLGSLVIRPSLTVSPDDISRLAPRLITLTGVVDSTEPSLHYTSDDSPDRLSLTLRAEHMEEGPGGSTVSGLVAVRIRLQPGADLAPPDLPAGTRLRVRGCLELPPQARNPGGFDYRAFLARHSINSALEVDSPAGWQTLEAAGPAGLLSRLVIALRTPILNHARLSFSLDQGAVLAGMLLGDRQRLSPALREVFERTGTAHVLATAGLHVGVVALLALTLLRRCRLGRRPASLLTIALLAIFALMAGERAAVVRAALMASIALLGLSVEREPDAPSALGGAALLLLAINPKELFDPGFQFSFLIVGTLLLLLPLGAPLSEAIGRRIPGRDPRSKFLRRTLQGAAGTLAVTVAAQLGAMPLTAYYFNTISLAGMPANVLILPLLGLILPLGFAASALGALAPICAVPLDLLLRALLGTVLAVTRTFSAMPGAVHFLPSPAPASIVLYYALLWLAAIWLGRLLRGGEPAPGETAIVRPRIPPVAWRAALATVALPVLLLWPATDERAPSSGALAITFLDVGQGDGAVIQSPTGRVMLVDTGGVDDQGSNEGERTVGPFLRARGIRRIDLMLLTHPHADHIGGAAWLLAHFPTGRLLENGAQTGSPLAAELETEARRDGVECRSAPPGSQLDLGGGAVAELLAPTDAERELPPNDGSVVMRITYGRTHFLLVGDAEAQEESDLLASHTPLAADVLKVGHHGSSTSTNPDFLAAVRPRIAIISVGAHNVYGHPSPVVTRRLRDSGAQVYRTDQNGAITVWSDGRTVHAEPMHPAGR